MAKYCYKCGAEMDENDGFCSECGTAVVELSGKKKSPVAGKPVGSEIGEKSKVKLNKKILFAIGIIAVMLILVIVFKGGGAGFSSPEEAFEAYANGYIHWDFDRMIKAYPDFVIKHNGGEDELKESLQRLYDADFSNGGFVSFFEYEASNHSILDKDEAKRIEQEINDTFGSNVKFSAVATVDYESVLTYEGEETRYAPDTSGYAVKYKGKWYFFFNRLNPLLF